MTHEVAKLPDGGVVSVVNGSLDWVDDELVESFDDREKFRARVEELSSPH